MHSLISVLIKSKVCKEVCTRKLHKLEKLSAKTVTQSFTQRTCLLHSQLRADIKSLQLWHTFSSSSQDWFNLWLFIPNLKMQTLCCFKCYLLRAFHKSIIKKWQFIVTFWLRNIFFLVLLTKVSERWNLANFVVANTDVNLPDRTQEREPEAGTSILSLTKKPVLTEKPSEKTYSATAAFVPRPCFSLYSKVLPFFYLSNPRHRE